MIDSTIAPISEPPEAKGKHYQAKHAQLRQRVRRYKRRAIAAAILGFGGVSLLIAKPDIGLSSLISSMSSSTTTTQTSSSSSSSFFNQQGGSSNGSASQQSPVTSSGAS
jgi:hypothetical protein